MAAGVAFGIAAILAYTIYTRMGTGGDNKDEKDTKEELDFKKTIDDVFYPENVLLPPWVYIVQNTMDRRGGGMVPGKINEK